ncbi:P-loop containing nucleoside triphosphate hydrolase protein [Syncephalis fuscata]|nr:P-loop containing nucleoside triphosphate hydrolase protein [Syncephalis fuscata]
MTRLSNIDGIPAEVLDILSNASIYTAQDVLTTDKQTLCQKTNLSHSAQLVEQLYSRVINSFNISLDTASSLITSATSFFPAGILPSGTRLSTGYTSIDRLLNGGLLPGQITELFGPAGAGKTQIAFSTVVQCLMLLHSLMLNQTDNNDNDNNQDQSANGTTPFIAYIDTCGSFSAHKLYTLLCNQWSNREDCMSVLKYVRVFSCNTIYDVFNALEQLGGFSNSQSPLLIVLDSVSAVLAPLLSNQARQGHVLMSELAYVLSDIAHKHSSIVLILNSAVRQPIEDDDGIALDSTALLAIQPPQSNALSKPALGATWSYTPHARIYIARDGESQSKSPLSSHRSFFKLDPS